MAIEVIGTKTLPAASGGIEAFRLVRIDSSNDWAYCGVGETPQGRANNGVAATYQVSADLWESGRTFKCVASGAISALARVYTAASGKVSATESGAYIGFAMNATTADGGIVEVLAVPQNTVTVTIKWSAPPAFQTDFIADRAYRIIGAIARVDVVGSDGGAVTGEIKQVVSGTSIASGTVIHASTINLKGTAHTNQVLTLSSTSADLDVAAGSAIGLDPTGTTTAAQGCAIVFLVPK